jgi:hypothetical protein
MENNCTRKESAGQITDLNLNIQEFSGHVGCEKYAVLRQELNNFLLYLNRSEYSSSWQDQVHNLYISLFHLEMLEMELYSSDLPEGIIYQSKIIKKIQILQIVILDTIEEIKTESAQHTDH